MFSALCFSFTDPSRRELRKRERERERRKKVVNLLGLSDPAPSCFHATAA
jgi:hypothetical protein